MAKRGEKAQDKAYQYICENIDKDAIENEVANAFTDDIISTKIGIIEVKQMPQAQCGQFVFSDANKNILNQEIKNAFPALKNNTKLENNELCKKWVKNHYSHVNYFCTYNINTEEIRLQTAEEFFATHTFFCVFRGKASGSSCAPKWVENYVSPSWGCFREGKKLKVTNQNAIGKYGTGINTRGVEKRFWVNDEGEIRVLSDTKNLTFVFNVKEGE